MNKSSLLYRLFSKPRNLEEAIDKAKRVGWAEIRIYLASVEGFDHHFVKIKSGFASFNFRPLFGLGYEESYRDNLMLAQKIQEEFREESIDVTLVDKYKR